ncbi:hypothetical protein HBI45_080910 [Parastagonospora nodorum]|nr:hypothetical protein HBI45_080910 [Parastagonospora nodorum]
MAGTRRQSRAGDTADTNRQQHLASHATSLVNETVAVAQVPGATMRVVESAEREASSRPGTPINRSTKGFCKNCGTNIGEYYNSWHKVTKSYYAPALLSSYRSLLKRSGRQKAASRGTAIEGCTIQPLACPLSIASSESSAICTESPIGFTVIDAPAGKKNLRNRDFFKLGRIELRCEASPHKSVIVEPQEDIAPDLFIADDSNSPSPAPDSASTADAMDIDSRPSSTQHAGPHHLHSGQRHERHHQPFQQPLQQIEASRQSLPPPSAMRSPTTLAPLHTVPSKLLNNPLPSVSPAVRPHEVSYIAHASPRESSIASTGRRDYSNGSTYPRSLGEVSLDAIERLQTQISQNSGALAAHTRDIRRGEESFQALEATLRQEFAAQVQHQAADIQRVDEAVARLHLEMQGMRQALENVSHEIAINRGADTSAGQTSRVPNAALELMAQQVAVMSHKTSELDNLRVTVEIMKEKIYSLEQGAQPTKAAPALQGTPHVFQPSHGPASSQTRNATPARATPAVVPRARSPVQTPTNPPTYQSFDTVSSSTLLGVIERDECVPGRSAGWASINAGTKRTHMAGVETAREATAHVPGSPKRQKMAATDPQASSAPSETFTTRHSYASRNSDVSNPRLAVPPPTLPSQHSIPESSLASQTQHSTYVPFTTQDGPSDDSWRPESQRIIEHRPRGRGRGGGPGSRGGRVRKSMPAQVHQLGSPEWERDDWQGISESQAGPEGYYNHVARSGRGIARRGSGGGGRGGYAQSERAASLGSQGMSSPGFNMGSPNDPYAHTKKTRTKPIRNADGVLIRKDGRPDMRSQSSAANLRKVHARKEGELSTQGSPTGFTRDASPSVQLRHSAIMGKMFPTGLDESRRQNDYAHQVFEEDRDHTAHPRNRNHQSTQNKSAIRIKKEDFEQRRGSNTGGAHDGNVDMDKDQDEEGDHEQGPSRHSEHAHDAHPEDRAVEDRAEPMVPETQVAEMESEATLPASASTLQ